MGVIRVTVYRIVGLALALLVNIAASILLARKLSPAEYAAYQSITKRIYQYISYLFSVVGFWVYRYAVQGVEGTGAAALVAGLAASMAGLAATLLIGPAIGVTGLPLLLGSTAVGLMVFYNVVQRLVNAVRPVRFSILVLLYRLLYSSLIVGAVYLLGLRLLGAFAAAVVAAATASALGLLWLRGRVSWSTGRVVSLLGEWLRGTPGSSALLVAGSLTALDVALAYPFAGELVVAAFFAANAGFSFIRETLHTGLQYLHALFLDREAGPQQFSASLRISLILAAPFTAYFALHPQHLVFLFNPSYAFAAPAVVFLAAEAYAYVYYSGVYYSLLGLTRGRGGVETAARLTRIALPILLANITYLALLFAGLLTVKDQAAAVSAWSAAFLAKTLLADTMLIPLLSAEYRGEAVRVAGWAALYVAIALLVSAMFPPAGPPSPRFWENLLLILAGLAPLLLAYAGILLVVDPFTRKLARTALRRIHLAQR